MITIEVWRLIIVLILSALAGIFMAWGVIGTINSIKIEIKKKIILNDIREATKRFENRN